MDISHKIKENIREIKDFPKDGISFKDITPLLKDTVLCREITDTFSELISPAKPDAIACIESRGFWFGMMIAQKLNIPFIPIRKLGKLPYETNTYTYELEYGKATMEIHADALKEGWKVVVHDDLLATGGTASAAGELIKMQKCEVAGFLFIVGLSYLRGKEKLLKYSNNIWQLAEY